MCGRYTLTINHTEIEQAFGFVLPFALAPRYNIAPSQEVLTLVHQDGALRPMLARWGLIPFWARDPSIGSRTINARAETVAEKPAFRAAYRSRRCLVLADGWYEWQAAPGGKVPHWIHPPGGGLLAFAGLWERWAGPDGEVVTCTMLTTEARGVVREIHSRMPVLLEGEGRMAWVDPGTPASDLASLLRPYDGPLETRAVSQLVNSPRNDGPACLEPVG